VYVETEDAIYNSAEECRDGEEMSRADDVREVQSRADQRAGDEAEQIGRASCRERV